MILEAALVASLSNECSPNVEPQTMQSLIYQESSANPFAIGVVGSPLVEQPKTKEEAIETAKTLIEMGANISLGLGQINYKNLPNLKMTVEDAFDYCKNIKAADEILSACFIRANRDGKENQDALKAALSCYYSNNFRTGMIKEKAFGNTSYVERIAKVNERLVPSIKFSSSEFSEEQGNEGELKVKGEIKSKEKVKNNVKAIEEVKEIGQNWDVFNDF